MRRAPYETAPVVPSLARALAQWAAFALGDAAVGVWLWFAGTRFLDVSNSTVWHAAGAGLAVAVLGSLLHGRSQLAGHRWQRLVRAAAFLPPAAVLGVFAGWIPGVGLSWRACLWWGAAAGGLTLLLRLAAEKLAGRASGAEVLRLLLVGVGATLALLPFYWAGSIGAGDAYWYTIMLADVVAQLRAGEFPFWVGQSEYAFNGTVYPLRLAPAFQYAGALLDQLTAGRLEPFPLKNAVLCLSALAGGFSAYACLRPLLPRLPLGAALLAVLWILSPGVLTPLMRGDMYMTFMTLPFVPLVLHGCWRLWARNDAAARGWIGIGLAGTLFSHAPIALWLLLIAGGHCAASLVHRRRDWRREIGLLVLLGALLFLAGSYPAVSAATLDNQLKVPSTGESAWREVAAAFPGSFLPLDARGGLSAYQLGYSLAALFVLALLLLPWRRPHGTLPFVLTGLGIAIVVLPVPWITRFLWLNVVPGWFVTINNVWPMQRLFLIWTLVGAFAIACTWSGQATRSLASRGVIFVLLLLAMGWSWSQANYLGRSVRGTTTPPQAARQATDRNHILLTRYSYSSFSTTPSYVTHSYMEPWWENRLLDRTTQRPFLSNADAAAPRLDMEHGLPEHPRLVQSGVFLARNLRETEHHDLDPALTLEPGRLYALRFDFAQPGIGNYLQIIHPSLFREYMLPDSGAGLHRQGPPQGFGSLPSSSKVMPLALVQDATAPQTITLRLITPRRAEDVFPLGEYWLYTYDRAELPINVESWVPYRARVETAVAAYLETPRLWLKHWRAKVNGDAVAVEQSPDNLVMVPIAPGRSTVELRYQPPGWFSALFYLNFSTWVVLFLGGIVHLLRPLRTAA